MISRFRGEYAFLSNFHPCKVEFDLYTYPSAEHAFQAAKTTNLKERIRIREAKTPAQAKRIGRTVTLRENWDEIRIIKMYFILREKFRNPRLKKLLLGTGNQTLVEGNDHGDTFWGICKGKGKNHLGSMLMAIRREIKNEEGEDTCQMK